MPYSKSDPKSLPEHVQKMPANMQHMWMDVWNSAHAKCLKDGGKSKDCEASAFAQANAVVAKQKKEDAITLRIHGASADAHRAFDPDQPRDETGKFTAGGGGGKGGGGKGGKGGGESEAEPPSKPKKVPGDWVRGEHGGYELEANGRLVKTSLTTGAQDRNVVVNHYDGGESTYHTTWEDAFDAGETYVDTGEIEYERHRSGVIMPTLRAATMKTEGAKKFPASAYLVVEDPEKPSTWHLRVYDENGKPDHRLMGGAWAALTSPQGHRGNKYEGPGKAEAVKKLKALYKKEDMETPGSRARKFFESFMEFIGFGDDEPEPTERAFALRDLYYQVQMQAREAYPDAWLMDVYDDGGLFFAIFAQDGKIYRSPVTAEGANATLGEWKQVEEQFSDVPNSEPPEVHDQGGTMPMRHRTSIIRQSDGRVRWLEVSCSAVLNRVGEIDSRALFDSFRAHAEETGEYPLRDFYHLEAPLRVGECDWIERDGNLLLTSGLYDDSEIARAEIAAREREPEYWGSSIMYLPTSDPELVPVADGVHIPAYRSGILQFISTLPESQAAALYTRATTQEVTRMLTDSQFQALVRLFGGDEAKAREELARLDPDALNRMIAQEGQVARTAQAQTPPPAAPTPTPAPVAPEAVGASAAPAATPAPVKTPEVAQAQPAVPVPVEREVEIDDKVIGQIVEHLLASGDWTALVETVNGLKKTIDTFSQQQSGQAQEAQRTVRSLTARLDALEKDESDKRSEWLADLPAAARQKTRVTFRPREARAPEGSNGQENDRAVLAEATLASMKTRNER